MPLTAVPIRISGSNGSWQQLEPENAGGTRVCVTMELAQPFPIRETTTGKVAVKSCQLVGNGSDPFRMDTKGASG